MSQKYDAPTGAPPAYYNGSDAGNSGMQSPAPAHVAPQSEANYYSASPSPQAGNGYPPPALYPQMNGYYAPGPQMGYQPQQQQVPYGYPPQQGHGPGYQGGYYGAPGMYGQPQGQYMDDRRGGNMGFAEALCAGLACCCCLDACLLF